MTAVTYETEYPCGNASIENVDLLHDSNKSQEAIIEHLRHQLLELSIERNSLRHQQNDAVEEATLQKKALEEQLESVKESHKSTLAHWQKKCSALKVEVISLEKRLGVLNGQRQVDPDGQCGADYDISAITEIQAKYNTKLQQLNSHVVSLNSEVEFWKAEHDKVKMKYDAVIFSKRRAECDSIGSKEVIESMRNEIERLNRQLAEKEKQLQSQKKNKIFSSPMKKKKRDEAKECAHALSLDDVKMIFPCNDFSETSRSSKTRHFSENPFHSVQSDDEKDDSSEVRSSCRESPTRSMKSMDTEPTCSMASFDTDPARSMISIDTDSIPISSHVDDMLKSPLSSRKASTTYHPLPDQIPSPTTFTGELQSCLVSRMPYKDKQSGVDGIYSGHIDVATKLPNGNGMLKCMNGDVLSGEWRFGVLQ